MALSIAYYKNLEDQLRYGKITPWTPANLATAVWYDAADASTITEAAGAVSQWDDKSGNGYHSLQATGAFQPTTGIRSINGLNALDFSPVNAFFPASGPPQTTETMAFAVVDYDTTVEGRIFDFSIGAAQKWYMGEVSSRLDFLHSDDASPVASTTPSTGEQLVSGYRDGDTVGVGKNAVYTTINDPFTPVTITNWFIGARSTGANPLDAGLGELVICNIYSEDDRQKMEGYLAWKWGLTANLPVSHPYKNGAPTV